MGRCNPGLGLTRLGRALRPDGSVAGASTSPMAPPAELAELNGQRQRRDPKRPRSPAIRSVRPMSGSRGGRGPDVFRIALGGDDDDLPESASFTDTSEGGGNLVEREGAVDVDLHLPGDAQVGKRLEVGRTLASRRAPRSIDR